MAYAGSRMSRSRSNICLLSGNKERVEASGAVIIRHRATLMRWPFFLEIPRSLARSSCSWIMRKLDRVSPPPDDLLAPYAARSESWVLNLTVRSSCAPVAVAVAVAAAAAADIFQRPAAPETPSWGVSRRAGAGLAPDHTWCSCPVCPDYYWNMYNIVAATSAMYN
jgi:hypothetical protein